MARQQLPATIGLVFEAMSPRRAWRLVDTATGALVRQPKQADGTAPVIAFASREQAMAWLARRGYTA